MIQIVLLSLLSSCALRATLSTTIDHTRVGLAYAFSDSDNNRKCGQNMAKGFAASTLLLVAEKNMVERGMVSEKTMGYLVGPAMFFGTTLSFPHTKTWSVKCAYFLGAMIPFVYSFFNRDSLSSIPPRYQTPSPQEID